MFVEHENSAKETALHLNIHRNSLAYRLKRIAQISSIDFQDGNTIFVLKLSFNIIKLGLK
jgi:DNA-binding PucR family transcriptional regulator